MKFTFRVVDNYPYIVSEDDEYIILDGNELKNYVGEKHKFFNGDVLERTEIQSDSGTVYKLEIINSKIRSGYILGTFSTNGSYNGYVRKKNSKVNRRHSAKIYYVKPLDKSLPDFLVPFGGSTTGNIVIKFKFSNWDKMVPEGVYGSDSFSSFICKLEDNNLEEIMLQYYEIYPYKFTRKFITDDLNVNELEKNFNRRNFYEENENCFVFTVDPDGCEDKDDAISVLETESEVFIGVHIAQPIYNFRIEELDLLSKHQFSTIYGCDGSRRDLFGKYHTSQFSLEKDLIRPAYSIIFQYIKETDEIFMHDHYPSFIKVNENFDYDSPKLSEINECVLLKKVVDSINSKDSDYHDIISYWMINANAFIGNYMRNEMKSFKVPYRVNDIDKRLIDYSELPEEIKDKFDLLNNKKGFYEYPHDDKNCYHSSLNEFNYCHFTSPIRRIVDNYIHYYLTYGSYDESLKGRLIDLENINKLENGFKKFSKEIFYKQSIEQIFQKNSSINEKLWIYRIISKNKVHVYLENLKVYRKINIYHPKFSYLVTDVDITKINEFEISKISLKFNGNYYEFNINSMIEKEIFKRDEVLPRDMILPLYLVKIDL